MFYLSTFMTIVISLSLVSCSYDCNNPGFTCHGECHYYGSCICNERLTGYDCSVLKSSLSTGSDCKVTCQNNGRCYDGNKCLCSSDYTGHLCEKQTTGARCTLDGVVFEAYRPIGFDGETYLSQSRSCKLLQSESDVPGMIKFERKIFHGDTSMCGLKKHMDMPNAGDITYEADIYSTFVYNSWGTRDFVDNVKCQYKPTRVGLSMDAPDSLFPIKMSARDGASSNVQATTQSAPISLLFSPQNIPDVKGAMVDYMEVYSINSTSKEYKSVVAVKNGCAQKTEYNVAFDNLDELDPVTSTWIGLVKMQAFIIFENEPLLFNYRLRFCPDRCSKPTCAAPAVSQAPSTAV
uniref:EGF-like domain containing protein 1 n=1 Tax=Margaritifera margaritifera TaxID=102329 RepID=ELDP1_PINMG|nr:RecName: Full=EGF-like domain containing protein 1; Flags: Precursor [Pinctada margaritifera]CCE46153.1 egf-like 1 [Pinctada margaritifera]